MEQNSSNNPATGTIRQRSLLAIGIVLLILLLGIIALQILILYRTNRLGKVCQSLQDPINPPTLKTDIGASEIARPFCPLRGSDDEWARRTERAFRDASQMFDDMDSIFNHTFRNFAVVDPFAHFDQGWDSLIATSAMDMREDGDEYVVLITLPPDAVASNLSVQMEGRILSVSSAKQRRGRNSSETETFETRIQIPGAVGDIQEARALVTNGTLRIVIPKSAGHLAENRQDKILL